MAAGEMGCHSATIMHGVLDQLSQLQYDGSKQPGEGIPKPSHVYAVGSTPKRLEKLSSTDPLAAAEWDGKLASTEIDYLANGGAELAKAIEADSISNTRLGDALEAFIAAEQRSKARVEEVLAKL